MLSLEVAQLCVLESSSHVQELRPAGFSDSSAVPAAIPALGKGFSLKRGNSVLPEAGSKVQNSRALLTHRRGFFCSLEVFVLKVPSETKPLQLWLCPHISLAGSKLSRSSCLPHAAVPQFQPPGKRCPLESPGLA